MDATTHADALAILAFDADPRTTILRAKLAAAKAEAERVSAHVASYLDPEFASWGFVNEDTGEALTNHDDLWLAGEATERDEAWYRRANELNREHGYDVELHVGPDLAARRIQTEAENALIAHYAEMTGCPEAREAWGRLRERLIAHISAPVAD